MTGKCPSAHAGNPRQRVEVVRFFQIATQVVNQLVLFPSRVNTGTGYSLSLNPDGVTGDIKRFSSLLAKTRPHVSPT